MGRFRKRSRDIVESEDGFTVQVTVSSFPGLRILYKDGPRTMHVSAEALAKTQHMVLYQSSMTGWEPPYASETVDHAIRQAVLARILAALSYTGDVVELEGRFPAVRNHVEGQVQLKKELAAAKRKWRKEDEIRRKLRDDTLEDHRHRDTPK